MIIKIRNRDHPYIAMDKRPLMDKRLSFCSRGILAYCMTQPSHLRISIQHLIDNSNNGKKAIQTAFRELRTHGYAKIEFLRHEKSGKVFGKQWVLYEYPQPTDDA